MVMFAVPPARALALRFRERADEPPRGLEALKVVERCRGDIRPCRVCDPEVLLRLLLLFVERVFIFLLYIQRVRVCFRASHDGMVLSTLTMFSPFSIGTTPTLERMTNLWHVEANEGVVIARRAGGAK